MRILAYVMACVMSCTPLVAQANLGEVLDNIGGSAALSVNAPGRFQSSARSSYSAGGFDLRAGLTKNTPSLISFTGPKVNASCSGVSMFFGGFSFISGREFEQLLRSISSGVALGFVSHLALKTLCPQCEAVVQLMQRINQIASMAAKDACKFGKALAQDWLDSNSKGTPNTNTTCTKAGETTSEGGMYSDIMAAMNSVCESVEKMTKYLDDEVVRKMQEVDATPGLTEEEKKRRKAALQRDNLIGNETWLITGELYGQWSTDGETPRQIMMNMLGTSIRKSTEASDHPANQARCGDKSITSLMKDELALTCAPQLTPKEVVDLFMCGQKSRMPPGMPQSIVSHCLETVGFKTGSDVGTKKVMECRDMAECVLIDMVEVNQSTLFNAPGLVFQVNALFIEAVNRVRADQKLYQGSGDEKGRKLIGLLQAAPYPLYQAINAAAVYPAASMDILNSLTVLVAQQLTLSYFDEYFRLAGRSSGGMTISRGQVERLMQAMESITERVNALNGKTATSIAVQEGVSNSIRSLNQAVQRQVMSEELFGANKFGKSLTGLVSGSTPAPAAGAAAQSQGN